MYSRVMVPLDGSQFGEHAIPTALAIANRTGATIDLVHVHVPVPEEGLSAFTPYQYQHVTARYTEWDDRELQRELEQLRQTAQDLAEETGLAVTASVLKGEVADALRGEAERFNADLIVMATHARTGLARAREGSVADVVVRRATTPVLLLHPHAEGAAAPAPSYRRVLAGVDGSPFSEGVLGPASGFARVYEAEFRAIQVDLHGTPGSIRQRASRTLPEIQVDVISMPRVVDGIIDAAHEWEADLIAIASHGRSGLTRLLTGSTASELLARTELPILLYRPSADTSGRAFASTFGQVSFG